MSEPKFVGILVSSNTWHTLAKGKPTRERFDYYYRAGEELGACVAVFTLSDIHFPTGTTNALLLTGEKLNDVTQSHIPLPRAIHNRIVCNSTRSVARLKRLERINHVTVYNARNGYNKLTVLMKLQDDAYVGNYVPETHEYLNWQQVADIVARLHSVVLKPAKGSLGKGLIKLTLMPDGSFEIATTDLLQRSGLTSLEAQVILDQLIHRPYLVQAYIDPICEGNRPYDLRVSIQKGNAGIWQVAGIGVKLGLERALATNIAQGGQSRPISSLSLSDPSALVETVSNVCTRAAAALEQQLHCADLGFDVGVDVKGKPWIFEVNSRDYRIIFQLADDWQAVYNTYRNPIAYGCWLLEQ